jgi:DNA-binding CsgD family transcriptional regulator
MNAVPPLAISLDLLDQAQDIAALRRGISDIRDIYGLSHAVFHVTSVPAAKAENPLFLLTYPDEWVSTYIDRDYFSIDPVVNAGRVSSLPFDWSVLNWTSPQTATFLKQADSYGVGRHGVTLTIRGPRGERSLLTLTSNDNVRAWNALRDAAITDLQVLGHYLHDRTLLISGLRQQNGLPKLSNREKQCLELVARGLVPKRIGPLLSLSERTVRLYLSSCRRKLQVVSTTHAVARAVSLEMIRS